MQVQVDYILRMELEQVVTKVLFRMVNPMIQCILVLIEDQNYKLIPVVPLSLAGSNYGTSGQVLTSQGSGSAVQWASPVVAGGVLQTVQKYATNEGGTNGTSFSSWSNLAINITPLSSSSHLWIWVNAIRLLVRSDGNEGRFLE